MLQRLGVFRTNNVCIFLAECYKTHAGITITSRNTRQLCFHRLYVYMLCRVTLNKILFQKNSLNYVSLEKIPPHLSFVPPHKSPPVKFCPGGQNPPPIVSRPGGDGGGQPPNYYKISEQALNNSIAFKSTIILCYIMII